MYEKLSAVLAGIISLMSYYKGYKSKGDISFIFYSIGGLWGLQAISQLRKARGCQ